MDYSTNLPPEVELLAPAGRHDALKAVLEAGADAVYLGGKNFNMRLHRNGRNFEPDEIAQIVQDAHALGRRIYVTVNNLVTENERAEVARFLEFLAGANVDAVIFQDLAVPRIVRERDLPLELHSSTMANCHSVPMALALLDLGVTRIVLSRDITLNDIRRIHAETGIELETFIHGDLCIAQSGQCLSSGMVAGLSANQGQCMKSCRWRYEFVSMGDGRALTRPMASGYFFASRDLCMINHIPDLVDAGICSLKIEGRMRDADYLSVIVRTYRDALDDFLASPEDYRADPSLLQRLVANKVRDFTEAFAFGRPGVGYVDETGSGERKFFSRAAAPVPLKETETTFRELAEPDASNSSGFFRNAYFNARGSFAGPMTRPNLSVRVGSIDAARAAVAAGCDWIYIAGDLAARDESQWNAGSLAVLGYEARSHGTRIGWCTPRVIEDTQYPEVLETLDELVAGVDALLVHNLGTLRMLRRRYNKPLFADFSFNVANRDSIAELQRMGCERIALGLELSYPALLGFTDEATLPSTEVVVHGSLPGMLIQHCIISNVFSSLNPSADCDCSCDNGEYGLRDEMGHVYRLKPDQRCRTHLLLPWDVSVLDEMRWMVAAGFGSLRLEMPFEEPSAVYLATRLYRKALEVPEDSDFHKALHSDLANAWPRDLYAGPLVYGMGGLERSLQTINNEFHTLSEESLARTA